MEGDALDQSRESLLGRRRWRGVHARSQLAWRQDPVISRSRHFHQTVAVRTLGEILLCALTRLKISKAARTGQFSEISVITLYSTKCSMKRMLSEPNPHCWPTSRSFRISERIYSLKLMESELAFRFASRCNAAGTVIAIRSESRRGRRVVFAFIAPRAPRLFACIRCTYIIPNAVVQFKASL